MYELAYSGQTLFARPDCRKTLFGLIKLKYKNNKTVKERCGGAVNNNRSGDCKHLGGCAENKTFVLKFKRR